MGGDKPSEDTSKAVQLLLTTMQGRFQQLSDRIINRIDDMGNRIDDLERSIATLMKEGEESRPVTRASATVSTPTEGKRLATSSSVTASPSGKLVTSLRTPVRE